MTGKLTVSTQRIAVGPMEEDGGAIAAHTCSKEPHTYYDYEFFCSALKSVIGKPLSYNMVGRKINVIAEILLHKPCGKSPFPSLYLCMQIILSEVFTQPRSPPSRLLNEVHRKWKWSAERTKKLKNLLTMSRGLVHYDPTIPIRMVSDASAYGIGAIISLTS